jgi:hypothetical protein
VRAVFARVIRLQDARRLLWKLARWVVRPALDFILRWNRWRRYHQAVAKLCHYWG